MLLKKIFVIITVGTTLFIPLQALAQSTTLAKLPEERSFKPLLKDAESASRGAIREAMKSLIAQKQEVNEQQHALLKTKLQTIKNEKKAEIILKLDTKIASISSRKTNTMTEAITKLQTILDTIKQKEAVLKSSSCNTGILDTAIINADSALSAAIALINLQAQKVYTITITDEAAVKANVGKTTKQLEQDLRNTHKGVMDAKQAVMKAAKELKKAQNTCMKISGQPTVQISITPSASQTPTLTPTVTVIPTVTPTVTIAPTITPTITLTPTEGSGI